ncbi:MAG: nickel-dependent lactate racemase [Candidatus Latescibacterota bacterium]|nr:nickel-dependent lactate racemase [Candidatus Latescibacterota bacterium]
MPEISHWDMTTSIDLSFGESHLSVAIESERLLGIALPTEESGATSTELRSGIVRYALNNTDGPLLREIVESDHRVAIVISDLTRPCPSDRILPDLLEELAHVPDDQIEIIVALGLHRPMTEAEIREAVGEPVRERLRVINHDPDRTVSLGTTSRGTPVEIFEPLVKADIRICVGNVEFHYFAGYSGGAKAVLPGCASQAAVTANHSMMVSHGAAVGRLDDNPIRQDIEEAGELVGVHFIVNVVVDSEQEIVAAFAGDVFRAHRAACEWVSERGSVPVSGMADIVLLGAGGHPTDLNLYQAQKALDNACGIVREGGIVIWVAECREGFGNQTFESWMRDADGPQAVLDRIQRQFVLGGHKAAAVAGVQKRARIYLVSRMSAADVAACGLTPFESVQQALKQAYAELGVTAKVLVMPRGGSTHPVIGGAATVGALG